VLRKFGADDTWYVPMILEAYGAFLGKYGDLKSALANLSAATAAWQKFHAGTADVLSSVERNAEVLIVMGRLAEADGLLKESEAIRLKLKDESTYPNGDVMARSDWLIASGRPDEALEILDRFAVKPAEAGVVSLTALQRSIQRGKVHLARNDALSVIAELTPTRDQIAVSPQRPYLKAYEADALLLIGKARQMVAQTAAARPALEGALSLSLELYDADMSPDVADAEIALAKSLAADGHLDEARTLAQRAEHIQATHPALGLQYRKPLRELERALSTSRTT
jgi:tetratricopeptide (TPR) repeat protein